MEENTGSENRSRGWWDAVSHQFDITQLPKRGTGPLAVRALLAGGGKELSATVLGKMLGFYRQGEAYGRQTIYAWERPERGEVQQARHAMTDGARECYRRLLTDLVQASSGGRFELVAHMGRRVWRFKLRGRCRVCGHTFEPRRRTDVHCKRHRRTHA